MKNSILNIPLYFQKTSQMSQVEFKNEGYCNSRNAKSTARTTLYTPSIILPYGDFKRHHTLFDTVSLKSGI